MIKYKLLPADISFSGMDQQLCASTSLVLAHLSTKQNKNK